MEMKIGFVGGGRIVRIFLQGFKNRGIKFQKVAVLEPDKKVLEKLKYFYEDFLSEERNYGIFSDCSIIFLAVRPPVLKDCLEKLKENLKEEQIVVSLAPKIRTNKIQEILNGHKEEAKDAISYMLEGSAKILFYSNIEEEETMDLIPAKPLANFEEKIKQYYSEKLKEIYENIKT